MPVMKISSIHYGKRDLANMIDVPEYDLNQPFQLNTDLAGYESMTDGEKMDALNNMWRNFTVSDTYEPGF